MGDLKITMGETTGTVDPKWELRDSGLKTGKPTWD